MPRILLVDDDAAGRKLIKLRLGDPYEVIESGDATETLALALEYKPNAILLDLMLPKVSGLELCQTLKSVSITQPIPIFVITGNASADHREQCLHLGAEGLFEKPVDFHKLRSSLDLVLREPRRERRSEPRIRLKAVVKLRGSGENGKEFELLTTTEDVSGGGFRCHCAIPLRQRSIVEVCLMSREGECRIGRAELKHTRYPNKPWQTCGFCFLEKTGPWVI
jgi:DNA-binding response OmpR family regulator